MQKYLQFLFCINHKKIAIDSICFGDVIFLSFLATWQHYRSTANLQDHFHSPPPKNKGCTDFKRITHMGSSSTREDARTCSAYDSQHPQQFYPHSLQDTTVYAVNEAAWRSLAAKGVGATGQTSQKKKTSNVPVSWLDSRVPHHRPIWPVRTRGSPSCPWIPRIQHWQRPRRFVGERKGASSSVTAGAE